jgi:hypothetical protein
MCQKFYDSKNKKSYELDPRTVEGTCVEIRTKIIEKINKKTLLKIKISADEDYSNKYGYSNMNIIGNPDEI